MTKNSLGGGGVSRRNSVLAFGCIDMLDRVSVGFQVGGWGGAVATKVFCGRLIPKP